MLLEGKKLLITGVLMDSSIAFHVAKIAQQEGATVILTSFGRTMKITQAIRMPAITGSVPRAGARTTTRRSGQQGRCQPP